MGRNKPSKKALDREVKVRRAEGKVKDLVSRTAKGTPVAEQARQAKEVTTRAAEGKVREAVKAAASKGKAATQAAPKAGLLARAGAAVRGGLAAARGKGGPLGLFALGASASMAAGRAVDESIAESRSRNSGKGPQGRNKTKASADKKSAAAPGKEAPKSSAAAPKKKAESPKKAAAASPKTSAKKGAYPTYSKNSSNAASFRAAFAAARKAGKGEFTWEGRRYNTKLK